MTNGRTRTAQRIGQAAVVAAVLGLAGCSNGGFDGVELNGKIFETVGLTGALGKKEEPKTEPRAPLVLPPPGERLPAPGESVAAAPAPQADPQWPNDPDKAKVASAAARDKEQEAYCKDGNWKEKAMNPQADNGQGPNGSCGNGIIKWIGKSLFGD